MTAEKKLEEIMDLAYEALSTGAMSQHTYNLMHKVFTQ